MRYRLRYPLVLLALVGLAALATPTRAEEAHAELTGFYADGEYDLLVDAKRVDAEILFSRRAAAYLLSPDGGKHYYLVAQRKREVSLVSGGLIRQKNGDVDLTKQTTLKVIGSASLERGDILIKATDFRALLTPRGPALGALTGAGLLAHSPQYGLIARAHAPSKGAVTKLKAAAALDVEVFHGSWCARCKQLLGHMLAVETAVDGSKVTFSYYGLPAPPAAWKEAHYAAAGIKGLPAAVVRVKGKVVGRLGPGDFKDPEAALVKLLR